MKEITKKAELVWQILSAVYDTSPWTRDQIVSDMQQDTVDYFFVQAKGRTVGFLSLQYLVGETEVTNLAVLPDYQGNGLGRALLSHLDDVIGPLFLEVRASNDVAQSLYTSVGFKEIGKRPAYYHNPVEDAVLMRRDRREMR